MVRRSLGSGYEKFMVKEGSSRYAEAGVDIDKGNEFVERIKPMVASTFRSGVLTGIGGFGGLFALGSGKYKDPVLVSSTDGVGTKLMIAQLCGRHDTIGIDLVAMCVNDIVVSGAHPLFFPRLFRFRGPGSGGGIRGGQGHRQRLRDCQMLSDRR